jgi:hypothetical protein
MDDPTDGGKEFRPGEQADADAAASTHGGGKDFASDVDEPETDERATTTESSGKTFSPSVQDPEDEPDTEGGRGSGKQFEPGRDRL